MPIAFVKMRVGSVRPGVLMGHFRVNQSLSSFVPSSVPRPGNHPMTPEFEPMRLTQTPLAEPAPTGLSTGSVPGCSSPPATSSDWFDSEGEEASARAQTLMIDLLPEVEDNGIEIPSSPESSKYLQGVIQGKRAYVITNLLGESEILVQPQMVWTIGRNRDAAIPLKDRVMSRRHAVLLYSVDVGFQLIDLNSMNGSFINGSRIHQRQPLKDGDHIRLGSINFTFFVSRHARSLDAIHPEVLARFNESGSFFASFTDYAALEDPEILFKPRE